MGTIEDIERAVERLTPAEFAQFRAWFEAVDAARFDYKIEQDAASGKLDAIADEALQALKRGHSSEL